MKAEEFAQQLLTISVPNSPPGRYACQLRDKAQVNEDPVLDLVYRFDCSQLQVGMITFLKEPREYADRWQVGKDEADRLMLDKRTGEVLVEQLGAPEHIISRCAVNGDSFLSAIYHVAKSIEYLASKGFPGDLKLRRALASSCSAHAGGSKYEIFYRYILTAL